MLDIKKLKAFQPKLDKMAANEREDQLIEALLNNSEFKFDQFTEEVKPKLELTNVARTLNYWAEKGLISEVDEGRRRKHNKLEILWIEIVTVLREFGMPIENIRKVKSHLLELNQEELKFSILQYCLLYSVLVESYYILVYQTGKINILPKSKYLDIIGKNSTPIQPHIVLDILQLGNRIYPTNNFDLISNGSDVKKLTEKEALLLFYLRTGDYDTIKVRIKDGNIYLLEGEKQIKNVNLDSLKAINDSQFQNLEIKFKNGKKVSIHATDFKKL